MIVFRRCIFVCVIPLHIAAVVWLVFARALFGLTFGWFAVMLLFATPIIAGALAAPVT